MRACACVLGVQACWQRVSAGPGVPMSQGVSLWVESGVKGTHSGAKPQLCFGRLPQPPCTSISSSTKWG